MAGKMVEITCKCGCRRKKMVREADRKRGWGLYYDKSCKAKHQESKTGQYANFIHGMNNGSSPEMDSFEDGWDGHKNVF